MVMATVSFSVLAEAATFSVSIDTPVINGKTVTITGKLSDDGERLVSIFVLPKTVGGNDINSVDAMLELRKDDCCCI